VSWFAGNEMLAEGTFLTNLNTTGGYLGGPLYRCYSAKIRSLTRPLSINLYRQIGGSDGNYDSRK